MTAPVLVDMDKGKGKKTMSFILPSHFGVDAANAPLPKNDQVKVEPLPSRTQAARTFSWGFTESAARENLKELLKDLEHDSEFCVVLDETGNPSWVAAGYNAPFTIPFLKTNEVLVDVAKKDSIKDSNAKL